MTQQERDEEAAAAFEYERMRAQGISLAEIGAGKVKIEQVEGEIKVTPIDDIESGEKKGVSEEERAATTTQTEKA